MFRSTSLWPWALNSGSKSCKSFHVPSLASKPWHTKDLMDTYRILRHEIVGSNRCLSFKLSRPSKQWTFTQWVQWVHVKLTGIAFCPQAIFTLDVFLRIVVLGKMFWKARGILHVGCSVCSKLQVEDVEDILPLSCLCTFWVQFISC